MRKFLRLLIFVFLALIIVLQFFQPEKNQEEITADHILEQENLPESIQSILTNSCLDCHSNQTNYHWYHQIAPASWMVNHHIAEGKAELNLSEWGQLEALDQISALEGIKSEVERELMPLKSYTAVHRDAKLTDEQIAEIKEWTEQLSQEILIRSFN